MCRQVLHQPRKAELSCRTVTWEDKCHHFKCHPPSIICSSVTQGVRRAAGSDDPKSHSLPLVPVLALNFLPKELDRDGANCNAWKGKPPHEADVVPTPSDYPHISSSPPAGFKFTSSLSLQPAEWLSPHFFGLSYWNFTGKPGNSSFLFCHVDAMCQVQIVKLSAFKITLARSTKEVQLLLLDRHRERSSIVQEPQL